MKHLSIWFAGMISVVAVSVQAHHSFTAHFDMANRIEIRGTVVDFKLRSPHASMVVDGISYVNDEPQEEVVQRWEVESMAAAGLRQMGMSADSFQPGDAITLIGNPNREPGFRFINSSFFITADGEQYSFQDRSSYETVADDDLIGVSGIERLAGRWSSPGGFGQSETPLPLNEHGRETWKNYQPKLSPANTCEPMNFPDMFNAPYLFDLRLEGNTALLYSQAWEVMRTVPLNNRPTRTRLDGLFGITRARVEGEGIVLESGGFPPSLWGLGSATQKLGSGADMPSSARKTLLEKFTVSQDGQTLIYEYTVKDPIYLSAPYSDKLELNRITDDSPMYDYDCEVEAAAMFSRSVDDPALQIGE
ncbi:MAG: DUF6152 family protein [Gammaproteobacteria bacterium]|nr:DUF6152 family protein [Gammaproteobacteria bacterium]